MIFPLNRKSMEIYNYEIEHNKLPINGLCACLDPEFETNFLTKKELIKYRGSYWVSDASFDDVNKRFGFTELRQNVLLFYAAMQNEL